MRINSVHREMDELRLHDRCIVPTLHSGRSVLSGFHSSRKALRCKLAERPRRPFSIKLPRRSLIRSSTGSCTTKPSRYPTTFNTLGFSCHKQATYDPFTLRIYQTASPPVAGDGGRLPPGPLIMSAEDQTTLPIGCEGSLRSHGFVIFARHMMQNVHAEDTRTMRAGSECVHRGDMACLACDGAGLRPLPVLNSSKMDSGPGTE